MYVQRGISTSDYNGFISAVVRKPILPAKRQ
jgi:hypothetical protein